MLDLDASLIALIPRAGYSEKEARGPRAEATRTLPLPPTYDEDEDDDDDDEEPRASATPSPVGSWRAPVPGSK